MTFGIRYLKVREAIADEYAACILKQGFGVIPETIHDTRFWRLRLGEFLSIGNGHVVVWYIFSEDFVIDLDFADGSVDCVQRRTSESPDKW